MIQKFLIGVLMGLLGLAAVFGLLFFVNVVATMFGELSSIIALCITCCLICGGLNCLPPRRFS